jgi:DNA-directed RNA polymerase I subunit RPA1
MARAAILREMGAVFGAYKIQVDARHLELIADYMVSPLYFWHLVCS